MIQNKYALPLSVKAHWRGDDNSTEEIVIKPCDKDDAPDFYLLCDANDLTVAGDWADGTENAYYALADIRDRTNALQGIPTDQLGEVKKAWLFCKLQNHMFDRDGRAMICGNGKVKDAVEIVEGGWICVGPDETIIAAKTLRSRGADFGELNALLDSVKEER